jgi:hypothetical protein
MAAGSGVDVQTIRRANIMPELTQAHCTVFGAWGPATVGNKLLHFRGLDWDAMAPINQFPVINLYEPTEEGSHPFANIGYLGMIGTLTAISKIGISAGEKVMIVNDPSIYPEPPEVTISESHGCLFFVIPSNSLTTLLMFTITLQVLIEL